MPRAQRQLAARALPTDAEARERVRDAALRNRELMRLRQVLPQQPGRPDRGAVAQLARVGVDDAVNERVNDAVRGARATAAWHGAEATRDVVGFTRLVLLDPVVDGASADAQALRHVFDAMPGGEPQ